MCLIVFSWQPGSQYPLILAANRDEFHQRPTLPVHHWQATPDILGGVDLQSGGSWLAINKTGRLAAVTNYREVPVPENKQSRGHLVKDFINGNISSRDYLAHISQKAGDYAGFNLLVWDGKNVCYFSNRTNTVKILSPGVYGLSNRVLDTPWPKLVKARSRFYQHISQEPPAHNQLIEIMHDSEQALDHELPDTGIGLDNERRLSSCFIKGENYGTRNTSALIVDKQGSLRWVEQNYDPGGKPGKKQYFEVDFNRKAMLEAD